MIDVQSSNIAAQFRIESVGVTGLNYPLKVKEPQTGDVQSTTAAWKMGVTLPADKRGTHMSRFIQELHARTGEAMGPDELQAFADKLAVALEADTATVTTTFQWFRAVAAPVTGRTALIDCQVTLSAVSGVDGKKTVQFKVPAKALCPCSKAISDRGAHNQRSDIQLTVDFAPDAPVPSFARLISLVETSASSPVYPLLKREDEKYITEYAYDNPAFVEDIVRSVAAKAVDLPAVKGFVVEAINRESIHAHDCYARIVYTR